MSSDLFKAILAMDAYNRGYKPGIEGLSEAPGTKLGNATILDSKGDVEAQSAGFYAIAYKLANGETVISYRGTDEVVNWKLWDDRSGDLWEAWTIGGGNVEAKQATLAFEFYNAVKTTPGVNAENISLTGHSSGGGLAGLANDGLLLTETAA